MASMSSLSVSGSPLLLWPANIILSKREASETVLREFDNGFLSTLFYNPYPSTKQTKLKCAYFCPSKKILNCLDHFSTTFMNVQRSCTAVQIVKSFYLHWRQLEVK
jgi:hypothetical protein